MCPLLLKTFLPSPLLGLPRLTSPLTGPNVGLDGDKVVPVSQQIRVVKTPVEQVRNSRKKDTLHFRIVPGSPSLVSPVQNLRSKNAGNDLAL